MVSKSESVCSPEGGGLLTQIEGGGGGGVWVRVLAEGTSYLA